MKVDIIFERHIEDRNLLFAGKMQGRFNLHNEMGSSSNIEVVLDLFSSNRHVHLEGPVFVIFFLYFPFLTGCCLLLLTLTTQQLPANHDLTDLSHVELLLEHPEQMFL